jgi:N-acetyl-1-D-myo-inositol-2-amino-2-deoxy-alpha-D-glucopyranoside deacetylase
VSTAGVLAVFSHPDDESLLAGGTLAACAQAGLDVGVLSLTRGEAGESADPAVATPGDLASVRTRELEQASRALGASWTECLDFPDGSLQWVPAGALTEVVEQRIAEHRPEAVITFAPEGLYWHPDHLTTHRVTVEAVAAGDSPRVYGATWPRGLAERIASELAARGLGAQLWGLEPATFGAEEDTISTVLDVGRFLPTKLEALRRHRSQLSAEHLLATIPDEMAGRLLGREYFVRLHAPNRSPDWLVQVVERA